MSIKRLSLDNAQNLISKYNAEIKALDFQAGEIKKVLKELGAHHAKLKKVADKKSAAAAKKAAAAAKKKAAAAAKKKAAAAKKKAAAAKKAAKKSTAKKAGRPAAKKKAGRPAAKKKAGRPAAKKKAGRPAAKKKAGRPAAPKKAGRPAAKKKAGRPAAKKKTARKSASSNGKRGRKMSYSAWDTLVMDALKGQSSPVRTSTLLDKGGSFAKKAGGNSTEKYVRAKVAASLQKLVNKTKEVKKVPAEGRGYSYLLA